MLFIVVGLLKKLSHINGKIYERKSEKMFSCKLPDECSLACSGGPDSMGVLYFLLRSPERLKNLIFVHHDTCFSDEGEGFVRLVSKKIGIPLFVHYIDNPGKNQEAYWHGLRHDIFQANEYPVITAHHLDDQVEQYLMTTIKTGRFIPIPAVNGNIYRPFLFFTKDKLTSFAKRLGLGYLEDPDNNNIKRHRNYVRHILIKDIENGLGVGLRKVIRKVMIRQEETGGSIMRKELETECPICKGVMKNNVAKFISAFHKNTNVIAVMVCPNCGCEQTLTTSDDDNDD